MSAKSERLRLNLTGKAAAGVRKFSRALGLSLNDTGAYLLTFGIVFFRYVEVIPSSKSKHSAAREQGDYDTLRGVISEVRAVQAKLVDDVGTNDTKLTVEISAELFKAMRKVELRPIETAAAYLIELAHREN